MSRHITAEEQRVISQLYAHREPHRNPLKFWQSPRSHIDPALFKQLASSAAIPSNKIRHKATVLESHR